MGRKKKHSKIIVGILLFLCLILSAIVVGFGILIFTGIGKDDVQNNVEEVEKEVIPFPEILVADEELENKFYYNQLKDEEARLTYKEILEGLKARSNEIYAHTNSEIPVGSMIYYVLNDYPGIFWCDVETEVSYELIKNSAGNYMIVYPEYLYSPEEVSVMKDELEAETRECIEKCSKKKTDYRKIKYVYDYLIDTVEYNLDAPNDQNAYSALVAKETVCAGYARAAQYLLEKVGVYCTYVTGTVWDEEGSRQGHAWNIVKCNENYYFMDVTWGDPVYQQEEGNDNVHARVYDYLCCSEAELFKTHTLESWYEYPACQSEDLNYYRRNGMFYETFDEKEILEVMYESIEEKKEIVTFKFGSEEDYKEALESMEESLFEDGAYYLARYYGLAQVYYSYDHNPNLWKINIYWSYE